MNTVTAVDAAKAATAELHEELRARGHWLGYVVEKAAVVSNRIRHGLSPIPAEVVETEVVADTIITVVGMDHYFVMATSSSSTIPITIWIREDGEIVYNEVLPNKQRSEGISKRYPIEEMGSRRLKKINEGFDNFNYSDGPDDFFLP